MGRSMRAPLIAAALLGLLIDGPVGAATWVVCPAQSTAADCGFKGDKGIPQAIERASSGDTILIRAGRYSPDARRDVRHKDVIVRAYALIENKDLSLLGEPGAILDGARLPSTAIAVHRADVTIRGLEITGFRYDVEEDDVYDGHGIFVIDGNARIDDVTIRRFQKMGLTGRGDSRLEVSNLRVLDGHVAIWLHEMAYLRLHNGVVRGNDSSAIAAYDSSVAHISNSVIDSNARHGLFARQRAALFVTNSLVLRNKLSGANAAGDSRISLDYSSLFANAKSFDTQDKGVVLIGANVIESDPQLDADYRTRAGSPLIGRGDPDLGSSSRIGPAPAGGVSSR